MSRSRPAYAPEFRQQILELVQAGRTPDELSKEYEPTAQTIRNWLKQAGIDSGERQDGPTTDEKAELARLRKENRRLRQEREILKKAAAWFAQESNILPPKSSGS
jgi:transposase